jgi:ribosomal protein S27AE
MSNAELKVKKFVYNAIRKGYSWDKTWDAFEEAYTEGTGDYKYFIEHLGVVKKYYEESEEIWMSNYRSYALLSATIMCEVVAVKHEMKNNLPEHIYKRYQKFLSEEIVTKWYKVCPNCGEKVFIWEKEDHNESCSYIKDLLKKLSKVRNIQYVRENVDSILDGYGVYYG